MSKGLATNRHIQLNSDDLSIQNLYTKQMLLLREVVKNLAENTKFSELIELYEFLSKMLGPDLLGDELSDMYSYYLDDRMLSALDAITPNLFNDRMSKQTFQDLNNLIMKGKDIVDTYNDTDGGLYLWLYSQLIRKEKLMKYLEGSDSVHLYQLLIFLVERREPLDKNVSNFFQTYIQPQEWVKEICDNEIQEINPNDQQNLTVDHNLNDPNLIIENNNHEDLSSTEDNDEVPDIPPFIRDPNNGNIILLDNPPPPESPKQPSPLIEQSLFSKVQPDIKDIQKKKTLDERFQALVDWFDDNESVFDKDSDYTGRHVR